MRTSLGKVNDYVLYIANTLKASGDLYAQSEVECNEKPASSGDLKMTLLVKFQSDRSGTGMLIFEALPTHLKIHSYFRLLDPEREEEFRRQLDDILASIDLIEGLGVSGFMKMPYKDTKHFTHIERMPERYYPRNPRAQKSPAVALGD